jgi:DNA-binding LacI/PurR family transcriptional regulator
MAADHFLELGCRNFAYCGFRSVYYSERRCDAFVQYLRQKSRAVDVFESVQPVAGTSVFDIESSG